jgi:hypothetical protein
MVEQMKVTRKLEKVMVNGKATVTQRVGNITRKTARKLINIGKGLNWQFIKQMKIWASGLTIFEAIM